MSTGAASRVNSSAQESADTVTLAERSGGRRLVYLLSRYPAVSHTFFLNEVLELRKLGFDIDVASINRPDRLSSSMPEVEALESKNTFYVKSAGAFRAIAVASKTLVLRPAVFFRGLAAALRLSRWDLAATLFSLFYFVEALLLGDWMRRRNHHHLHIHFCGPVATVGMLTSQAWNIPYSLGVHGPDEFYDMEKFYVRQKVENASLILCISNFCRSQLMKIAGPEHWKRMHVARLGIDPTVFLPAHPEPSRDRLLEIICVGRLVSSKGQQILIEACALLRAKGYLFRLCFVGGGPDQEYLQAFAAEKDLDVRFEGPRTHDETRRLLAGSDIFALASFAEGVPVALMEAMAMELPCVSTVIAGIPELIRDGLDGLLVPASSVEAMASALQRLIDDENLRSSLGAAGRRRVIENYNLQDNVRILAGIFREHIGTTA